MSGIPVLYVEDEADDVLFMRLACRNSGWALEAVENGRQAIAYLSGEPPYADRERHPLPALVLLDLNLPLVSGFDVLRWVREQPAFRELPVVIFSSSGRAEDRARAAALGADDYLLKPSSGDLFREAVDALQRRGRPPVARPSR